MQLVQPLFNGEIDIVGDVHGEIDALKDLRRHLGYSDDGLHPENRRLVFVGDLTDRGPDSPAVIELVQGLIESGRAQCVLGNHDLNILLGDKKHDNHWFFGEKWSLKGEGHPITPAVLAYDTIRKTVLDFFRTLPLALERDGLRVVHACWDEKMVEIVRNADDVVSLYKRYEQSIEGRMENSGLKEVFKNLARQNENPVKVLTSGKERRAKEPFFASGKLRQEERVPWWEEYTDKELCVFGHYSFFKGESNSSGGAICVDYAVAKRWMELKSPDDKGPFKAKLAALRIPEMVLVFEDGEQESIKEQVDWEPS
ncbi:Bis(5'-nucleosyl)-tetraphosphatase PrpE [asymmetrical] [Symmachiella dynata]|uniref:metallophosphoesterase n=1 Tax=Symmachiella dynata TaxID=2527995 RepID=UPI0011881425|nr:metallophosphoesterase [Symmachiella dynata]QDT48930.1 Bis(5'-nucleosyl)-tetraphosphatase PrpE [asymmetrical] [Symmachiella dynata]